MALFYLVPLRNHVHSLHHQNLHHFFTTLLHTHYTIVLGLMFRGFITACQVALYMLWLFSAINRIRWYKTANLAELSTEISTH